MEDWWASCFLPPLLVVSLRGLLCFFEKKQRNESFFYSSPGSVFLQGLFGYAHLFLPVSLDLYSRFYVFFHPWVWFLPFVVFFFRFCPLFSPVFPPVLSFFFLPVSLVFSSMGFSFSLGIFVKIRNQNN